MKDRWEELETCQEHGKMELLLFMIHATDQELSAWNQEQEMTEELFTQIYNKLYSLKCFDLLYTLCSEDCYLY